MPGKKTAGQRTDKTSVKTSAKAAPKAAKAPSTVYKLKVGDKTPAFQVASTAGEELNARDLKGAIAVLYFYPKDMTSGCTLEGHDFARLHGRFKKLGCEVYGVSRDSLKSHGKFIESCKFPFALLADETSEMCRAFDVIQIKSMYGRKYEGIERSTFVVAGGKIAAEWRKVKVPGHGDEVLAAVQALHKGE